MPSFYRSKWDFNVPKRLTVFSAEFEPHVQAFKEAIRALKWPIQHADTSLGSRDPGGKFYVNMRVDHSELRLNIDLIRLQTTKSVVGRDEVLAYLQRVISESRLSNPTSTRTENGIQP